MAQMVPKTLRHCDVRSKAEEYLFSLFKKLDDKYTVIYSANWCLPAAEEIESVSTNRSAKRNGEVDFIIIHPNKGIIFLEVKGGKIQYIHDTNIWISGEEHLRESPIEQIQQSEYKIRKQIEEYFSKHRGFKPFIKSCYAIALPNCLYDSSDFNYILFPRELWIDANDCSDTNLLNDSLERIYNLNPKYQRNFEDLVDDIISLIVESPKFSETLKNQMKLAGTYIDELTEEQYAIMNIMIEQNESLLGKSHIKKIGGSAGSGKTLVAVETAIRLAKENKENPKRIFLLCHNFNLAEYLRKLTKDTDVIVEDFCSWIARLNCNNKSQLDVWNHHNEPTEDDLLEAHCKLVDSQERYDIIIVDEGQDFRQYWWEIIEDALKDKQSGRLYIFYDNNQSLLAYRANYPSIAKNLFSLSRNCRNAGKIFDFIKKNFPQFGLPEANKKLQGLGSVEFLSIKEAICQAYQNMGDTKEIVVLTTEYDPVVKSVLNELEVELPQPWSWKKEVLEHFRRILNKTASEEPKKILEKLQKISDNNYPTNEDIEKVVSLAKQVRRDTSNFHERRLIQMRWIVNNNKLHLSQRTSSTSDLLNFYCSPNWIEGIPKPRKIHVTVDPSRTNKEKIHLSTVASFKGLESNCIILFITQRDDLEVNLFVGLSRAKFLLYIVDAENILNIEREEKKVLPLTSNSQPILLLSLKEAEEYSGLPRKDLKEAIREGKLRGQLVNEVQKIKPKDLDRYMKYIKES